MNRLGTVPWGAWLLISLACAVDQRGFDAPEAVAGGPSEMTSGTGGVPAMPSGAGGVPVMVGAGGAGASPVATGGATGVEVPAPLPLAVNGTGCTTGGACASSRCEPSTLDGESVCCSLDCADSERCSVDGARCEPLPRELGQACGDALACDEGLLCSPAGAAERICCSAACSAGEFCVDAGTRCEVPLRQLSEACTLSAQCVSGFCDLDRGTCRDNPCSEAIPGSYCGRGAQCDAEGSCNFTGMGMLASGQSHTCAILADGSARCWGDNTFGQTGTLLELPIIGDVEAPSRVPGLRVNFSGRRALQLTAGVEHTCALLDDGNVRCWGRNVEGQLVPTRPDGDIFLPAGARAAQIDGGALHTCALLTTGEVTCWGLNGNGQCGFGHTLPLENVELPTVQLPEPARLVSNGTVDSCALFESGALNCWGRGTSALGYAAAGDHLNVDASVDVGGPVLTLSGGVGVRCAVIEGGFVSCWGDNTSGILGYGHSDDIGLNQTPAQAASLEANNGRPLGGSVQLGGGGVVQVEVNTDSGHVCARFSGGAVRCWGSNTDGSLGYGHEINIGDDETPAQAAALGPEQIGGDVPFGRGVLALADGGRCAVLNDRSVICWGRNSAGQLGMPELFPDGTPALTPADLIARGIGPVSIE